jgi:hypothetical protein
LIAGDFQDYEHAHLALKISLAFRLQELLVQICFGCFVSGGDEVREVLSESG